jgi:hypothetical protein
MFVPPPWSNAPDYVMPPLATAYNSGPGPAIMPSFEYYPGPANNSYNNGVVFQSLTPWVSPYFAGTGRYFDKAINGSSNDGIESAFNAYLGQYVELYLGDADAANPPSADPPTPDTALWDGELQSWKGNTDSLRVTAPETRAMPGNNFGRHGAARRGPDAGAPS